MPRESIGSVNTGELPGDEDWIESCQRLAIQYIKLVCGEPPFGATLGIVAHDHDLGTYTTIGVYSEYSSPMRYVANCENALDVFNAAVSWGELKAAYDKGFSDEDDNEEHNDDLE